MEKIRKTDEQWRQELDPDRYAILRCAATEPPWSGDLNYVKEDGVFRCGACGAELFRSDAKFDSGSGWPSFFQPADEDAVETEVDTSHGMRRIEVRCAACDSHLGHVFPDGPHPTGQRYCINSLALDFDPTDETTNASGQARARPDRLRVLGSRSSFEASKREESVSVDVRSEKLASLVDENVEVEQLGTGFTFTEGPIWNPNGAVPALLGHARRHAPALGRGERRRRRC